MYSRQVAMNNKTSVNNHNNLKQKNNINTMNQFLNVGLQIYKIGTCIILMKVLLLFIYQLIYLIYSSFLLCIYKYICSFDWSIIVLILGRNGILRRKLLCCEYETGKIFFASESMSSELAYGNLDEIDDANILNLRDIIELRRGTDIDPESPYKALEIAAKAGK